MDENGVIYEFYTVNQDGSFTVKSPIISSTLKNAVRQTDFQITDHFMYDDYIFTIIEHESDNSTAKDITVEQSNIKDALKQDGYESTVSVKRHVETDGDTSDDEEVTDYGNIVNTSKGPAYVYAEGNTTFKGQLLTGKNAGEEITLPDPYDLAFTADYILYIDFDKGYYFANEIGEDVLRRLDIASGEPLYDGADDKTIGVAEGINAVMKADEDSLFIMGEDENNNPVVQVISYDLELRDALAYTGDNEDGLYGFYYVDKNTFMSIEDYEYQRKTKMKLSFSTYVTNN